MLRVNQDVVSQIELFENRNSAQKLRLQHETFIRLALQHVANAYQLRIPSKTFQLRSGIWRTQIDPSDYDENRWRALCQLEAPASFFERLPCLHGDRSVQAGAIKLPL